MKELLIFILVVFLWSFMGLMQEMYFPIKERAYLMAYGGVVTLVVIALSDFLRG